MFVINFIYDTMKYMMDNNELNEEKKHLKTVFCEIEGQKKKQKFPLKDIKIFYFNK